MCGRFILGGNVQALAEQFSFTLEGVREFPPRYNIAPSQPVAVVRARNVKGDRELALLRWGLIPGWAKDPAMGNPMINARAETAAEKPSFRAAFKRRRCLILADGFYEWKKVPGGKQPYHIRREDGAAFAMAGLWEHWQAPDGGEVSTCAILTTSANAMMAAIHGRMPVILAAEHHSQWLDAMDAVSRTRDALLALVQPREWEGMTASPVSTYVNNPRNEGRQCIEPVEPGKPDREDPANPDSAPFKLE